MMRKSFALVAALAAALPLSGCGLHPLYGGGTGSMLLEAASGVFGELQAGSFMFMDADYGKNEREAAQPPFEPALFVKTQVVSIHSSHVVCDAGHKSHAIDSGMPLVHALEDESPLEYFNGGDEHGILRAAPGSNARLV